jgi:hypothetical protein
MRLKLGIPEYFNWESSDKLGAAVLREDQQMRSLFVNVLRYSCWAAVGAVVLIVLVALWILNHHDVLIGLTPGMAIIACIGGLTVVALRATVGIVTRYPAAPADRMTAIVLGRFLFGWLLGRAALYFYLSVAPWKIDLWRVLDNGWLELAFRLAGALAMVITGSLIHRPHGRFLLPLSWLVVLAFFVCAWFSFHDQFPHLFKRRFL